jgi:heparosan-N-sulfate-glucuronate 5-epimerase
MYLFKKINYWNRIFKAYVLGKTSQLTFWHGEPKINYDINIKSLGSYYMSFDKKAEYKSHLDENGVPMLDYQGVIGIKYNPIAIAQWGLGNYNIYKTKNSNNHYKKFIKCADWLTKNLESNEYGFKVWMHHFNWEYRDTLKSPWYSGLAQGQGISVLVRAYKETKKDKYKSAANDAIRVFFEPTTKGGVNYIDSEGYSWIEEYIVHPPTHILNGFIWALWGVYDYHLSFKDKESKHLYNSYLKTLIKKIKTYDTGYWSLYEHSGTKLKMIASLFYHKLHIVQLNVMYLLTNEIIFKQMADNWITYLNKTSNRRLATIKKIVFKVLYY